MLKTPYFYTVRESVKSEVKNKETRNVFSSKKILSIVGGNIRALRRSHRITISALAGKANISEKYLQGVEVGKRNISITNLNKIAIALRVNIDAFFIENHDDKDEKRMLIESRLKAYSESQLKHIEALIEKVDSIVGEPPKDK